MKHSFTGLISLLSINLLCLGLSIDLCAQTSRNQVTIRQLFPRNETYEYEMLKALGFDPNQSSIVNVHLENNDTKQYSELSPLEKAFGKLALSSAEILATDLDPNYTGPKLVYDIQRIQEFKGRLNGILAVLVMNEVSKNSNDAPTVALKKWATVIFKSAKIRAAKAVLDEYERWANDPCDYKADGYKPTPNCASGGIADLFAPEKPQLDVITKQGLESMYGIGSNEMAHLITLGLSSITLGTAATVLSSAMSGSAALTSGLSSGGLYAAFTGNIGSVAAAEGGAAAAGAAAGAETAAEAGAEAVGIGALGWASVVAAPVAAAILIAVVGTTEGAAVVEATRVKPMLQAQLGVAINENINLANQVADSNTRDLFFMAFMEATTKGFQAIPAKVDGMVRFYCQAGYIAKFKLSYSVNVDKTGIYPDYKPVEFNTKDLNVGSEESFTIPAGAKDIHIQGWYLAGDWKDLLDSSYKEPSYFTFTAYGTIFGAKVKNESPEVRSLIADEHQFKLIHGGGYVAWFHLSYKRGLQEYIEEDKGWTLGRQYDYKIPADATNIHLNIQVATGLAWEPWRVLFDKKWPEQENFCIKIYGGTLDAKWSSECQ